MLLIATGSPPTTPATWIGQWTTPVQDPETVELGYAIPTSAPYNVPEWMELPTEGGNHASVHPSVLDFFPNTWNGHRYWMGITGYEGGQNRGENPHIFQSDNGFTWSTPAGVPVPLYPSPGLPGFPDNPWNSDTELVHDAETDVVHMFYRVCADSTGGEGPYERIMRTSSSDGVTWAEPVVAVQQSVDYVSMQSPTIVRVPGGWRMWMLKGFTGGLLRYFDAPTLTGAWTLAGTSTIDGTAHDLWHVQIVRYGNRLYMAGDGYQDDGIYPAVSDDWGVTWTAGPNLITTDTYSWDDRPYRASLFLHPELDKFRLWYSAQGIDGWKTAYTHVPRSAFDSLTD